MIEDLKAGRDPILEKAKRPRSKPKNREVEGLRLVKNDHVAGRGEGRTCEESPNGGSLKFSG